MNNIVNNVMKYKYICIRTNNSIEIIDTSKDLEMKIEKYKNENILKIVYGNNFMELETVLDDNKTFYEKLIDNEISIDNIDTYIKEWEENDTTKTIYEYLGLTYEQYKKYKEYGIIYV